ncbi:hypothetical protein DL89DRAFT_287348 [Linderina pennispora]|uniref:Uncharacterized protein n=1 Tax=Linderina pennispora TaxID=61395 RepID=A0A1Y1VV74_9FUNG|nr:uncharacterized protein DL89DRAFT_287348 [Linderina pennispora]ORX65188.1 hypothetical protein DL89DRAFT_287348 [Linderina pennispora]
MSKPKCSSNKNNSNEPCKAYALNNYGYSTCRQHLNDENKKEYILKKKAEKELEDKERERKGLKKKEPKPKKKELLIIIEEQKQQLEKQSTRIDALMEIIKNIKVS